MCTSAGIRPLGTRAGTRGRLIAAWRCHHQREPGDRDDDEPEQQQRDVLDEVRSRSG